MDSGKLRGMRFDGKSGQRIGILHPGQMGIVVAVSARNGGNEVLWVSEGRSAATRERASQAGLHDALTLAKLCELCPVIVRSRMELSGFSNCSLESFASMRTLYFSQMGTSGPATLLLAAGRLSFNIAWPSATLPTTR